MQKIDSYIGFAKRSGNICVGSSVCIAKMRNKKIELLVVAEDVAEDTKRKLFNAAKETETRVISYGDSINTGKIAGNRGSVAYGIMEKNLAKAIVDSLENEKGVSQ